MTRDEAKRVLQLIARPHLVGVDSTMLIMWYETVLRDCDYELGLEIARELAGAKDRMPKPVHFKELLTAKQQGSVVVPVQSDDAVKTKAVAKAALAQMRQSLRGISADSQNGENIKK